MQPNTTKIVDRNFGGDGGDVVAMLQRWWEMVLRSIQAGGDPSAAELEKDDYCRLLCLIYKALLKPYNAKEAWGNAEEDWAEDCKGRRTMDRGLFMDAMFELVDMWTREIVVDEYVAFLATLFSKAPLLLPYVLLPARCSLLATPYLPLPTYYSLLATPYCHSLLTTPY